MDPKGGVTSRGVLHEVRAACRRVMDDAEHVRIDDDALDALAGRLRAEWATAASGGGDHGGPGAAEPWADPWAVDPDRGSAEERAGLVLVLATVNFGSGYHPHVHKEPGCSGATTMARAVRRWAATEPLTAARLAGVTPAEAHRRFNRKSVV